MANDYNEWADAVVKMSPDDLRKLAKENEFGDEFLFKKGGEMSAFANASGTVSIRKNNILYKAYMLANKELSHRESDYLFDYSNANQHIHKAIAKKAFPGLKNLYHKSEYHALDGAIHTDKCHGTVYLATWLSLSPEEQFDNYFQNNEFPGAEECTLQLIGKLDSFTFFHNRIYLQDLGENEGRHNGHYLKGVEFIPALPDDIKSGFSSL